MADVSESDTPATTAVVPGGFSETFRAAWARSGGWSGIAVAAAPTAVFVVTSALTELPAAVIAAGVTAVGAFAYRLARHEPLGGALAGLGVVVVCAVAAAVTGEARGFFLLPAALPGVVVVICLGSLVARRPVTGLLLNRLAGGPVHWPRRRDLLRVYDVTTVIAVAVNLVNFALQAVFYAADQTAVLAVAHVATGPVFAALVAGTVVAVRRRLPRPA
ncbi:DUF3159 domain-containing protein [Actinomycetospora endophytica]|uniref:DUF3159 domain-containing protein n=1 Tax=Actinomycetospora endophytica TaxID=2291215 RepID=A0ABS8PFP1_9PSEU|nr:DUF3159 domain-containing protein [Actinomycetospora endophytica]MCD2196762.1 DUF3159 domain-containing protein [Actinomycetospora endophytica]